MRGRTIRIGVGIAPARGAPATATSSRPWVPTDLGSKLATWLKPEDYAAASEAASITTWHDASGNGNDFAGLGPSGAPQATIANGINGFNASYVSGHLSSYFGPSSPSTYLSGRTSSATFFVSRNTAGGSGGPVGAWGATADEFFPFSGDGNVYSGYGSTARHDAISLAGVDLTQWHFMELHSAASDWQFWADATQIFSTASNTVGMGTFPALGQSPGGSFNGYLAEVVDLSAVPTTAERQQVEGYLAWKFGLQANLPGGHPYVSAAPTVGGASNAYSLTCTTGAFTLTGNAVAPAVTMPAATGAFALTGNAAALPHGYTLTSARGSYTLTGNAVALEVGHVFTAATGAFVLSGQAMTPKVAMTASTGAYTLTGNAMTPAVAMAASTGVYALTGNAVTLKVTMSAATGVFTLTGNAAGLNKVGSSTLTADRGSFTLTGTAAALAHAASLSAARGTFTLTGTSATLPITRRLVASTGVFTLTGNAASLAASFPALRGQFLLSGFAFSGAVTRNLSANPGSFVITGHDAAFIDFSPSNRQYPLAGIPQTYHTFPSQSYPLEGVEQDYPLRGTG